MNVLSKIVAVLFVAVILIEQVGIPLYRGLQSPGLRDEAISLAEMMNSPFFVLAAASLTGMVLGIALRPLVNINKHAGFSPKRKTKAKEHILERMLRVMDAEG